jgi:hypothetical protein
MNRILKIIKVLSWINVIFWGFICLLIVLVALVFRAPAILAAIILPGAVVLHSYASLQLQKSVRNPGIPLNNQTPVGIRFIGFIALFVGIMVLFDGVSAAMQPNAYIKQMQQVGEQMGVKSSYAVQSTTQAILTGIFVALIGLCVAVNVNLNFRLLRWYNYMRSNSNKSDSERG